MTGDDVAEQLERIADAAERQTDALEEQAGQLELIAGMLLVDYYNDPEKPNLSDEALRDEAHHFATGKLHGWDNR